MFNIQYLIEVGFESDDLKCELQKPSQRGWSASQMRVITSFTELGPRKYVINTTQNIKSSSFENG